VFSEKEREDFKEKALCVYIYSNLTEDQERQIFNLSGPSRQLPFSISPSSSSACKWVFL
jgi:hypothetical protein